MTTSVVGPAALRGRRRADGRRSRPGAWWAAVLLGGAAAGSFGGLASAISLLLPLVALAVGVWLLARRDHVAYLELTLWAWLVAPGVRRIVDYGSYFHPQSAILAIPYLLALLGLPVAFAQRQTVTWSARVVFLLAFGVMAYGTLVGLLLNGPTATLASFLNWVPPLALGFFTLMTPVPWAALRAMFVRVVVVALLLLGTYGVVQWVTAPGWDRLWLADIGTAGQSFGQPKPYAIRIWSLSNGPGPLAGTLVWLLVSLAAARRLRLAGPASAAGALALAISAVRAAWIGLALAVALLGWRGRVHVLRFVAVAAAGIVILLAIGGPVAKQVTDRVQTFSSGSKDQSASTRIAFQASALPAAMRDPFGSGIGSTGAGVRAAARSSDSAFSNTDSGYLEVLRTFGAVPGVALLVALCGAALGGFARVRHADPLVVAWSALLATLPVGMLFGNAIGLATWLALGAMGRADAVPAWWEAPS
jgi:O-Antigen ligase